MSQFHNLTIKSIKKETPHCISINFDVTEEFKKEYTFKAGQYVILKRLKQ